MEPPSPDKRGVFKCDQCDSTFGYKSNFERHKKVHKEGPKHKCSICDKVFQYVHGLHRHMKLHLYPNIPFYKSNEPQLADTEAAKEYTKKKDKPFDKVWLSEKSAERSARELGGDLWPACVVLTWGKYQGQTFKWLLENAVGWTVWLMTEYILKDEKGPLVKWQKKTLLDFCKQFQPIMVEIDRRLIRSKQKPVLPEVCLN